MKELNTNKKLTSVILKVGIGVAIMLIIFIMLYGVGWFVGCGLSKLITMFFMLRNCQ